MRKILTLCAATLIAISTMATEGALNGKFSVSATKKVYFSKGNLQYQASTDKWRFAEKQWHFVGGNTTGVVYENEEKCNNRLISDTYTGWIDLFGWGTGDAPTKRTKAAGDYTTFTDWGENKISNGGNADSLWRTLTASEWNYLIRYRTNADSLFTYATINSKVGSENVNVEGLILLPDNWVTPDGLTVNRLLAEGYEASWWPDAEYYHIGETSPFSINSYSDSQWQALEEAGAVFLPWTSYRDSITVQEISVVGTYWSSTPKSSYGTEAYLLNFQKTLLHPKKSSKFYFGSAVRLVQDYVEPNNFPNGYMNGKFSVAAGKQVQFGSGNLQYNPYYAFWWFASNQYDIIGADNKDIDAPSKDDIIDLFGWGTGGNEWAHSTDNADYATFNDWGVPAAEDMGLDGTWRTLTVDEWGYLLGTRANADKLYAKATVHGVKGMLLLPDNWDIVNHPIDGSVDVSNVYVLNLGQWINWEADGAVFLPNGGRRAGKTVEAVGEEGNYWTSSPDDADNAYELLTPEDGAMPAIIYTATWDRYRGFSVRLVRDCSGTTGVEETITPDPSNRKFIKDGQLLIERDGKTFNALGIEVR